MGSAASAGRQAWVNIEGISPNYIPPPRTLPPHQTPNQYLLSALFCLNTTRTIHTQIHPTHIQLYFKRKRSVLSQHYFIVYAVFAARNSRLIPAIAISLNAMLSPSDRIFRETLGTTQIINILKIMPFYIRIVMKARYELKLCSLCMYL